MEIIFVIYSLRSGGAEKQLLLLAQLLAGSGVSCQIHALADFGRNNRIEALLRGAEKSGVAVIRTKRWQSRLGVSLAKFFSAVRRTPKPLVWSWGMRADLAAWAACQTRPFPWIRSLRSTMRANNPNARWIWLDRRMDRTVALYVSNSFLACEDLVRHVPGALPRCRVIYNTLEESELAEEPVSLGMRANKLEVVLLGHIRYQDKGYDRVLDLAERVRAESLPIRFHIAGRLEPGSPLVMEIERRRLPEFVIYAGEVAHTTEFLRKGNVFLLMSRFEGLSNALVEAMHLGLPCISTRVGDTSRFAEDGRHLRLVDVGDVEAVFRILQGFLADWAIARRMAIQGRELCRSCFTPDVILAATQTLLEEVRLSEPKH